MAAKTKAESATKNFAARQKSAAKTRPTKASAAAFIAKIDGDERRSDCRTLVALMQKATGELPVMWGPSIIGFGSHHYKYESGREGEVPLIGFSPRSNALTLYVHGATSEHAAITEQLGRYTTGKACLYVKRLADVDSKALDKLIRLSVKSRRAKPAV